MKTYKNHNDTILMGIIQKFGLSTGVVLYFLIITAGEAECPTIYFNNMTEAAELCGLTTRGAFGKELSRLEELGFITTKLKGIPARKHITLNIEELNNIELFK